MLLTVQTLDAINDILNEITGYGSDRKVNFSIDLVEEEGKISFSVLYNDTEKVLFKGIINEENYIEAVKIEDEKEKEDRE
jgi:hypothetical protein